MYNCPQCKEKHKEYEQINSRYHSLYYAMDDYDRRKGKGNFKKKFPDSVKLLDDLLDKKTKLQIAHVMHEPVKEEADNPQPSTVGVPVIG
jgi:hypothetical protein